MARTLAESFLADVLDLSDGEDGPALGVEQEADQSVAVNEVELKDLHSVSRLSRDPGYASTMAQVRSVLSDSSSEAAASESQASTASSSRDQELYELLVSGMRYVNEIEGEIAAVHAVLQDLYAPRFPELRELVKDPLDYARAVCELGNEVEERCPGLERLLSPALVMAVAVVATTSSGAELGQGQLNAALEAAARVLALDADRGAILALVQRRMDRIAPNLSAAAGATVAAQLMGRAGGLAALAAMPACNVQVLGARRAHAAGLSSAAAETHKGFLFHSEFVQQSPPPLRVKALRLAAGKCSLLARVDARGGDPSGAQGRAMRASMEARVAKWAEPPPAKTAHVLPAPDAGEGRRRRGGKRYRRMKEQYGLTELKKQANRLGFNQPEEESFDGEDTLGLGIIGKDGAGVLRAVAAQQRQKLSAKSAKKFAARDRPGAGSLVSGLSSSLAFTPVQGIELANPAQADDRSRGGTESYFSEYAGFRSQAPKPQG